MKRILYLVNADWAFLVNRLPIALMAIDSGFEVHIACAFTGRENELIAHGLKVHQIPFTRSGNNPVTELLTVFAILKLVRNLKPDLIHAVTIKPVLYGGIIARICNIKAFVAAVSGLGFIFSSGTLKAKVLRKLVGVKYVLALGHKNLKVIFQNPHDRSIVQSITGLSDLNVVQIKGSGADLNEYKLTDEPNGIPVVAMACRLLKEKGVYEFVEAARRLQLKGIKSRFWLIGSPDYGNPHSLTDDELLLFEKDGVVELLGHRTDIADLFSKSNIVVLPSYYGEGLPKVLIEAAACGRAVITTDNPGCKEAILDGVTGILVPSKDSIALTDAIEKLVNSSSTRHEMGKQGRILAEEQFDIKQVVKKHLEIYQELINKNG